MRKTTIVPLAKDGLLWSSKVILTQGIIHWTIFRDLIIWDDLKFTQ